MNKKMKSRAMKKIMVLKHQLNEKCDQLDKMRQEHESLARTYGSELCAGDMFGKEDALKREIQGIDADIKLLQNFLDVGQGPADRPDLGPRLTELIQKRKETELIQQRKELDRQIKEVGQEIHKARRLRELLK